MVDGLVERITTSGRPIYLARMQFSSSFDDPDLTVSSLSGSMIASCWPQMQSRRAVSIDAVWTAKAFTLPRRGDGRRGRVWPLVARAQQRAGLLNRLR